MALTQISTAGVKDDAVTAGKIPANAVGSSELADNAVDTASIAADAVTGAKIADDAINSEHYTDGSIDTAHIADSQVTTAKIADDAVTADKLANSINSEIAANTAKTTNATHSGEVTGATALTIADNVVDEANLKVSNSPTNGYFLSAQSGNTGGLTWAAVASDLVDDTSPQLGGHLSANTYNIEMGDSSGTSSGRLNIGASQDLVLYHNGSNSIIDSNTGNLEITSDAFYVNNAANNEVQIKAVANGAVELYHNNGKKFETTAGGVTVTGGITTTAALAATSMCTLSAGLKTGTDEYKVQLGASDDLELWHSSNSNSYIKNSTGELFIASDNIALKTTDQSETFIDCNGNGNVELYHNNSKQFATTSEGAAVYDEDGDSRITFFTNGSSNRGSVYASSDSSVGFLNSSGSWSFRVDNNKSAHFYNHAYPISNNSYDCGSASYRWRNVYANDLQLSNEAKKDDGGNDVDGTWGDWTLQEGESSVFMINNRSGKKFRIKMEEV